MTIEDRLRRAIDARTTSVEPSADGFDRIQDKLLQGARPADPRGGRGPWLLAAAAVVVLLAAVVGAVTLGRGDDDGRVDISDRDTTITTPSTTDPNAPPSSEDSSTAPGGSTPDPGTGPTETTASTAPGVPNDQELEWILWPRPSSTVRFDDPMAAVRSFVRYYAHIPEPEIGEYQAGDNRSGEVTVGWSPGIATSTVLVRQMTDDKWYVIATTTENITVQQPASGSRPSLLTCPLPVSGLALAFEAQVEVRIDAFQPDGDRVQIARDYVMGSGSPPAGPFSDTIDCTVPAGVEDTGILTFWTQAMEGDDGTAMEIVSLPIRLR